MPESERIHQLFQRFLDANATEQELSELFEEADKPENEEYFIALFSRSWDKMKLTDDSIKEILAKKVASQSELETVMPTHKVHFLKYRKWIAAASVLILIGSAVFYLLKNNKDSHLVVENQGKQFKNDVAPGGNKALLTLGNGSKILLDSMHNGTLAQQGNTKILKLDSGKVEYATLNANASPVMYNTLTTPRGGQYQLQLSDGTKVWLDAASSISYPTAFVGKERKVEVSGQVYFEVVHKEGSPFQVTANGIEIRDIGTSFNVNTYLDEPTYRITLIEGSIAVKKNNKNLLLKRGEQVISENGKFEISKNVDIDHVMAWKNGQFNFEGTDVQTVLRQLSRWYDLEVVYETSPPLRKFGGGMSRDLNLSQVLEGFKEMKLKFRIDGKQLIVSQ